MTHENRLHRRVPIAASAHLSYLCPEGPRSIECAVASISFGGVGLYADCLLARGTAVSVEINFIAIDGTMKTDVVQGAVINSNEIAEQCYLCISFDQEINEQQQPFLYRHLRATAEQ